MEKSLTQILSKWSPINVTILLSSIVSKGVSFNLESLTRTISGLVSQSQRI